MKAEELRIGNLVTLSGSLILTVYEIHEDCFYSKDAKGNSFKNTWADLQPIPLSEEVQTKLHNTDGNAIAFTDKCIIIYALHNREWWFSLEENPYLHQVQNLYYSIMKEELEVSL